MTSPATAGGLLEQAIHYALGRVAAVTPGLLGRPTPCADWDLSMLLRHSCDSLAALSEGVGRGCVNPTVADANGQRTDVCELFAARASELLDGWSWFSRRWIRIGEYRLARSDFAAAGALEIAVHGWDVARACGQLQPIPAHLAHHLLAVAPVLVTDADRAPARCAGVSAAPLFRPPVAVPSDASTSDRLVAFLGRTSTRERPE